MAGGTWTTQNKKRPGVYIRFRSVGERKTTVGERGTAAICEALSWGPVGTVQTVEAGANPTPYTGYGAADPHNRFLTEIFKGSDRTAPPRRVLLYRPAATGSAAASAQLEEGALTVTARYPGTRGNDITVTVEAAGEAEPGSFLVSTLVDGAVVDAQDVSAAADLTANAWVTFSGDGPLAASGGLPLTGGLDGTVPAEAWSEFLTALEPYKFDILIYDGTDANVQESMAAFVKRLAEDSGKYSQLVTANMKSPNSQYVINVVSGVTLTDGTVLTPAQAAWWVGGAQAGALYNQSLTYAAYPGAAAVSPLLTDSQIGQGLEAGQLLLSADDGDVVIEQDINSLTAFTPEIGEVFRYNRTVRLCNTFANDIYKMFRRGFIGVVNNNDAGRRQFKGRIVGYLLEMQSAEAIQSFVPDDVEVLPGADINSVLVNVAFQVVGSIEKIYLTVSVS